MTKSPRKSKALTREDRALWQIVTDQVAPMINHARVTGHEASGMDIELDKLRAPKPDAQKADGPKTSQTKPGLAGRGSPKPSKSAKSAGKSHAAARPRPAAKPAPQPKVPPVTKFDDKTARRLAKGREEIDARLDLHGMRQEQAHHALRGFLNGAVGKGYRTVLVITGKGSSRSSALEPYDYQQPERGVLRRLVPVWLTDPDLRGIVLSFATAHVRHGGEGALYVRLRSRRSASR